MRALPAELSGQTYSLVSAYRANRALKLSIMCGRYSVAPKSPKGDLLVGVSTSAFASLRFYNVVFGDI